ncbi:UAA transporter [Caenorhabditis elegans]|nr:UAA transporter [Caenorhabditis elegans]CDK13499.1 UAA transporter [Caenorhabditis elegans]|eukprot:NP_001293604.1 yeast Homolog UDP-Gal Transporter [Caenorhabditis elegans]
MNHPLSGRQILATTVVFSALTADVVDGKMTAAKKPLAATEPKVHNK